jgi:hypothetical protein
MEAPVVDLTPMAAPVSHQAASRRAFHALQLGEWAQYPTQADGARRDSIE